MTLSVIWLWSKCRKWALLGCFFVELGVIKSQRQVLVGCSLMAAIVTCYQICCGWQFRLSAGQRTCASGAWRNRTPAAWNTWFHFFQSYSPQQSGPEPRWLLDLGSHAAACVWDADSQCRRTQAAMQHFWRLERSAAVLSTLLSASGESVCRLVLARREDTSNTCCRLFW